MQESTNNQIIRNANGEVFYEAKIDTSNGWIYLNWIGDIELDDIKKGVNAYLDLLSITGINRLLNDNTQYKGNFIEINGWIAEQLIPRGLDLGLRYFAHVLSPQFISRFSAVDLGLRVKPIEFKAFKTLGEAEKWLRSK